MRVQRGVLRYGRAEVELGPTGLRRVPSVESVSALGRDSGICGGVSAYDFLRRARGSAVGVERQGVVCGAGFPVRIYGHVFCYGCFEAESGASSLRRVPSLEQISASRRGGRIGGVVAIRNYLGCARGASVGIECHRVPQRSPMGV